jgi:hypothetical protein
MGRYTGLPDIPFDFLKVGEFSVDVIGGAEDGGRNGQGMSISRDLSGGGDVAVTLGNCFIQSPEEHRVINWIAARMNGSYRFANVPILTDWTGPFPTFDRFPAPFATGIPHSDGSLFDDGAGYSQATVWGKLTEDAGLHAGIVRLRVYNAARRVDWSEWFSIYHNQNGDYSRGHRAYRSWEIVNEYDDGTETIDGTAYPYQEYGLAISTPLREATVSGTRVELARPKCVMKFPAGFTLRWKVSGFWRASPTIEFVEAW